MYTMDTSNQRVGRRAEKLPSHVFFDADMMLLLELNYPSLEELRHPPITDILKYFRPLWIQVFFNLIPS